MKVKCDSCGAPLKQYACKCEYCGTLTGDSDHPQNMEMIDDMMAIVGQTTRAMTGRDRETVSELLRTCRKRNFFERMFGV